AEELLLDVVRIYRHSPGPTTTSPPCGWKQAAQRRWSVSTATLIRLKRRALGSRHADLALTLTISKRQRRWASLRPVRILPRSRCPALSSSSEAREPDFPIFHSRRPGDNRRSI